MLWLLVRNSRRYWTSEPVAVSVLVSDRMATEPHSDVVTNGVRVAVQVCPRHLLTPILNCRHFSTCSSTLCALILPRLFLRLGLIPTIKRSLMSTIRYNLRRLHPCDCSQSKLEVSRSTSGNYWFTYKVRALPLSPYPVYSSSYPLLSSP